MSKEIKLAGGKILSMRAPKVRDMMLVKDITNDMDREIAVIGNLTDMTQEELYDLEISDYVVLQKAFAAFQSAGSKI